VSLLLRKRLAEADKEIVNLQEEVESLRRQLQSLRSWLRRMPRFLTETEANKLYPNVKKDAVIEGLWSFSHASGLLTDLVGERSEGVGVTVDGVLCKDGVIPNSSYPNAFLLDGSRKMKGNIDLSEDWYRLITRWGATAAVGPNFGGVTASNRENVERILMTLWSPMSAAEFILLGDPDVPMSIYGSLVRNEGKEWRDFRLGSTRHVGDETGMLTWDATYKRPKFYTGAKWILLPTLMVDALPTASGNYRGTFASLLGPTGVADKLYWCMKDKYDAYVWVQLA